MNLLSETGLGSSLMIIVGAIGWAIAALRWKRGNNK